MNPVHFSGTIASFPVTVRIERDDTTGEVEGFLNGVSVGTFTDTTFSGGDIHLRAHNNDGVTDQTVNYVIAGEHS